ncbi:hypothetical protein Bhyg_05099, partial [Pseudolycoriella hygida]
MTPKVLIFVIFASLISVKGDGEDFDDEVEYVTTHPPRTDIDPKDCYIGGPCFDHALAFVKNYPDDCPQDIGCLPKSSKEYEKYASQILQKKLSKAAKNEDKEAVEVTTETPKKQEPNNEVAFVIHYPEDCILNLPCQPHPYLRKIKINEELQREDTGLGGGVLNKMPADIDKTSSGDVGGKSEYDQ